MCGICGEIDFSRELISTDKTHTSMLDAIAHRGPDDSGVFSGRHVWLGHRRLSIIDLSPSGRQPMPNEDQSIWVTFNGEIYNYKDLIPQLEGKGHTFRSKSDTEVILHLYEEHGEDFLQYLNGMFAIGLWDARREKLILARDRIGVKPIVYFQEGNSIVFSSELKALLEHDWISRDLDMEALELYFTFNFIPAPWTIYKGVKKLPPAHCLVFDKNGLKIRPYWGIDKKPLDARNPEEFSSKLRNLVLDSTRIRLYSDVPLGAFLSGGIDSSIVVAAAAKNLDKPLKTFCIGFPEEPLFDETRYAKAVAEMYGTDHNVLNITSRDTLKVLPDVLSLFDEPFADSSALPTFLISKLTREHVTVALTGDGGDEIFGGYRRYLAESYIHEYMKIPGVIHRNLIKPFIGMIPDSKGSRFLELARRMKIFVNGVNDSQSARHYQWMIYFPDKDREELFSPSVKASQHFLGRKLIEGIYGDAAGLDDINKMLFTDVKMLLPCDMLNKVDWMSMGNSLEIRSPLLDYRVAEMAFSIPGSWKVHGSNLKYILKKSFHDWLPPILHNRKKQGFEIPVGEWFKKSDSFKRLFWEVVNMKDMGKQGLFNEGKVKNLFDEHGRNARDNSHKLWALFVFQWWYYGKYGPGKR